MGRARERPPMRFTLSDARESPAAAAVFLLGVAVAAFAVLSGSEDLGASSGTPTSWLVGGVALAVAVTVAWHLRDT